ncbi:isocitrate/isopropylmalate dehydrogenase family protein [bacterium]
MSYKITLIPGDGIGPEITNAAKQVLEAAGVDIDWNEQEIGQIAFEKIGKLIPESALESIKQNKIALKGPCTTPIGKGFRSVNVYLRKEFDLYACLRPSKNMPGVPSRYENLNLVIVRENTEDLYAGIEFEKDSTETKKIIELSENTIKSDSAISIKAISESGTKRIVEFAFEHAKKNNRKKVTAVTKANIMKATDGLFLEVAKEVAKNYSDIEYDEKLIDNLCMQLVVNPNQFDVMVLPNLYGDIVSDLCAGLVGGLGLAPGANIGTSSAIFEPVHGSAPDIAGQNLANPIAMILSACMMLDYLNEKSKASQIRDAIKKTLSSGKANTKDLGGNAKTSEITQEIINNF